MQRRVVKGIPKVKDALDDFEKLGHDRTEPLLYRRKEERTFL